MHDRLTRYEELEIGQRACIEKHVTQADLDHFIAITGDTNPLHCDDDFARATFFGERIAHGMLSASLFSTLVGCHLPGVGAIYRSQTLEFLRPVHLNDTLSAWIEVTGVDAERERIELRSWIDNQRGECVLRGQAVASLLRQPPAD